MTIAEANAIIRLLRHLLDPDNVIPAERAAEDAASLTAVAQRSLVTTPAPDEVRGWVEAHAARLRDAEAERDALRAEVERLRTELAALIALHEYDELIFGGFICLHCTPDDCDDPDDNVYWPCPSLRAVGVTDEEAVALIKARRAENEARHRQTPAAGADDGTCGDCATGRCHGEGPDDCGCDRHNASAEATP